MSRRGAGDGVVERVSQLYGWDDAFTLFAPLCIAGAQLMATLWNDTPAST